MPDTRLPDTAQTAFATTPAPPYYIVAFSSARRDGDHGYEAMARRMVELAAQQPGFLGVESARGADGFGITNSYWRDEESIRAWKAVVEHAAAQRLGHERWYSHFEMRIGRIERAYSMTESEF